MRYPAWKYVLILIVFVISALYALPNLYPDQPAVQISGANAGTSVEQSVTDQALADLKSAQIPTSGSSTTSKSSLIRFNNYNDQLKAQDVLRRDMGDKYVVALNLAPTTPEWLRNIGAKPMKLGLDLRGGVHFTLEVDMQKAIEQRLDTATYDIRRALREDKVRFDSVQVNPAVKGISVHFPTADARSEAASLLRVRFPDFTQQAAASSDGTYDLNLTYSDPKLQDITNAAITQNLTTLKNRVNELGVSEAVVQRLGANRIVVELPGVQDTAEAKRILGRTANLEFRLVPDANKGYSGGPAPAGTEAIAFEKLDGPPMLVQRQRIVTGERVQDARADFDENGQAQVSINLDNAGGRQMADGTRANVGKQMAVLFIENKQRLGYSPDPVTGKPIETRTPVTERTIINAATIRSMLGSQFRITGVGSPQEANELALLLRAGALAAPMYFVEERTIGPSLGQQNIEDGIRSTLVGFALVALFMLLFYRLFGLIADTALVMNLAIILAVMGAIGAALSLPGIAGIVLTLGMAVDANVLIFERIREELRRGARPRSAIVGGYNHAFSTIFDANLTTLIVAFILFGVGTGPIKGFAVTLSIGILASMFTAITVTRGLVQLVYGGKRPLTRLSI